MVDTNPYDGRPLASLTPTELSDLAATAIVSPDQYPPELVALMDELVDEMRDKEA